MSHQDRTCPFLGCRARRLQGSPVCSGHEKLYRGELQKRGALAYQEWLREQRANREQQVAVERGGA